MKVECPACHRRYHKQGMHKHLAFCKKALKKVARIAETIQDPTTNIDLQRLNHMCDTQWADLSIGDKVMALSSLTFDPSNPNGD
jgi:hypothetical protein